MEFTKSWGIRILGVFLENGEYIGAANVYGKTSHTWELLPYMGGLPIDGKSSHRYVQTSPTREALTCMGRLPINGKTAHVWDDFPD